MLYQIDGKAVKSKPKGNFKKVVTVPGKLMNFLTEEREINCLDMCIETTGAFQHVSEVRENGETKFYLDGVKVEVNKF